AELADLLVLLADRHELAQLVERTERLAGADPGVEGLAHDRELVEQRVAKLAGDSAQRGAVVLEQRQRHRARERQRGQIGLDLATEAIDDLIGIAGPQRQGPPRGSIAQLRIAEQPIPRASETDQPLRR